MVRLKYLPHVLVVDLTCVCLIRELQQCILAFEASCDGWERSNVPTTNLRLY
jgi:hypothetical protein